MSATSIRLRFHEHVDTAGAALSAACAIHCIAFPLLLIVFPLFGLSFLLDETIEKIFIAASITVATANLCWGYRIHRRLQALVVLIAASIMIVTAVFILPHSHDSAMPASWEQHQSIMAFSHIGSVAADRDDAEVYPHNSVFGYILLILGGIAISSSHLLNRHFCRLCRHCRDHCGHSE